VEAKSDCLRLVHLLDQYRLRGRKAVQYGIWRRAVLAWIAGDATSCRKPGDWGPFAGWKAELKEAKRFRPNAATARNGRDERAIPNAFLSGLITADGSFSVTDEGQPRMTIRLRADDAALLRALQGSTDLGRVYGPYRSRSGNPGVQWCVLSNADTAELVDLLDQTPLGGRKCIEYLIWREAVFERAQGPTWRRAQVAMVQTELRAARRYRAW
jgi:hypothetical protein